MICQDSSHLPQAPEERERTEAAEKDNKEAKKMAETSQKALQHQTEQDIPFREDYFLPEDEAGTSGTLRVDEVSSDEADSEPEDTPAVPVSGSKVRNSPESFDT